MSESQDFLDAAGGTAADDLSTLSWVNGELRRSIEAAHKALRRHLKEAEAASGSDLGSVDPAVLRSARAQLHQGVGALEMVGLKPAAAVLRASEAAVQRMVSRPAIVDARAVETVEKASFALLDFLSRQLSGKPVSPVMLFPQYRAVQTLAGAERVHPADLWPQPWEWKTLPADTSVQPMAANDAARGAMETLVLQLMRQTAADAGTDTLSQMSDLCAQLGAGALESSFSGPKLAAFWQLAAAVFEAQAKGLLAADTYSKRLASSLLAQLRQRLKGQAELPERQAQDLLFFCSHARAPAAEADAPRLAAVRQAWDLDSWPTADYETARLGRHDPAVLALARKRVALAKDAWSGVAGGEMHRLSGLSDQFQLMGDSLQRLFPEGAALAQSLQQSVSQTVAGGSEPPAALAMEVATALLYVDASLEDAQFDHPELAARVQRLAQRIDEVRIGADPQPLDGWMEELYRRVSDRQTMGSVVQELRASLSEIEAQIDQYFRDPSRRELLIPVPAQLSSMRGVLSVLGMDQGSQAALHMRDDVEALAQTEVDPQMAVRAGTFDRLADNLGALSFLIDMLSVQPQLAKSLFRFDPETGSLSAVMGQSERVSAFAAFDDGNDALKLDLRQTVAPLPAPPPAVPATIDMSRFTSETTIALSAPKRQPGSSSLPELPVLTGLDDASNPMRARLPEPAAAPALAVVSAPPAAVTDTGLEDDAEMREIFIEEAREVIADARAAVDRLAETPEAAGDLTVVRRAFHTLKGSSRMVGLHGFGEAGWACEQLYNDRLATAPRMDAALRGFTLEALDYLEGWTQAIESGESQGHQAADVAQPADSLRLRGERLPVHPPQAVALPASAPVASPTIDETATVTAGQADGSSLALDAPTVEVPVEPFPTLELPTLTQVDPAYDDTVTLTPPQAQRDEPLGLISLDLDLQDAESSPAGTPDPAAASFDRIELDLDADIEPDAGLDAKTDIATNLATQGDLTADDFPALPTLAARVPGLPSAADLDLGFSPSVAAPAEPTADAAATDLQFDFDLDDLDGAPKPAADALEGAEALDARDAPEAPAALSGLNPAAAIPEGEAAELSLDDLGDLFEPEAEQPAALAVSPDEQSVADLPSQDVMAEPAAEPSQAVADLPVEVDAEEAEPFKQIGHLRIGVPLFNIYLSEAEDLSRRLGTSLAEWRPESERHPVPEAAELMAHSLAGNSATVGYVGLSALARALEHALMRSRAHGVARGDEADLFNEVAEEIRRLLHQFAAGFLREVPAELMQRLADHERLPVTEAAAADVEAEAEAEPAAPEAALQDAIDAELFPIFEEEADELLPQLQTRLREWLQGPAEPDAPMACMRTLHTLKGGARLAGALRLGEMAHTLETDIEALNERGGATAASIEPLLAQADAMSAVFEQMRGGNAVTAVAAPAALMPAAVVAMAGGVLAAVSAPAAVQEAAPEAAPAVSEPTDATEETTGRVLTEDAATVVPADAFAPALAPAEADATEPAAEVVDTPLAPRPAYVPPTPVRTVPVLSPDAIQWQRFQLDETLTPEAAAPERVNPGAAVVRVRAGLLDRLVNQAGEVSITRARIDADVKQMQASLGDLTESMERMRRQLRDIELQAETQIATRIEAAKAASQNFDPLEMDRFTRFQELTRFMAESVNDVATLQRSLQRTLQSTEDELAAQARLTRELQDDLLRTRMVEFDSISERLYRTVRQAAKETGKQVRVEIVGGAIEVDRGVLERMAGSFEHLLRNSVAHGLEKPEGRASAGKDASGLITITVAQAGNEVGVEFADDGTGLNLARIRQRGIERGLLAANAQASDTELAGLIFAPGFSTAETVTELAGRGVGLDVVRAEVNAMGGRVETATEAGKGTRFKLLLPLTTAVTQVVMLRCADLQVAVPSPLIELIRRTPTVEVERAYSEGTIDYNGETLPFFWLPALLRSGSRGETAGRTQSVAIVRSASQRVAVHIDEVLGNQEVVVKNVGPQLSRLPGLAGVTLLPSGVVALIYNPVALAALYGDEARARQRQVDTAALLPAETADADRAPLVMVVDDSLTVRRVTQRLLQREGYRVVLAKDGLDALERLTEERPVVMLSDIEMPRMDGFDLVRNLRADAALAKLPVVMITSRIAQKHREYAAELGVQHYLGKPYAEDELLALVSRYARKATPA